MSSGKSNLVLVCLLILCGSALMMAGALSYQTTNSPTNAAAERRSRVASKEELGSASASAAAIVDRYGTVLGLGNLAKPKPAATSPVNTDPLADFRLAGVVEQAGVRVAVFVVGEGELQKVVTLRAGDEAAAQWVVDSIGTRSAHLKKAGKSRKFELFE